MILFKLMASKLFAHKYMHVIEIHCILMLPNIHELRSHIVPKFNVEQNTVFTT